MIAAERCPRCGAPTFIGVSKKYRHCASIGCPWIRDLNDGREYFFNRPSSARTDDQDP